MILQIENSNQIFHFSSLTKNISLECIFDFEIWFIYNLNDDFFFLLFRRMIESFIKSGRRERIEQVYSGLATCYIQKNTGCFIFQRLSFFRFKRIVALFFFFSLFAFIFFCFGIQFVSFRFERSTIDLSLLFRIDQIYLNFVSA